ncbi:MAG: UxaA family hydrolase [Spirochaetales bacterium]|nr:UxaA family hydrolase [Spirochaetales bacterium]
MADLNVRANPAAILLHRHDSVATALTDLEPGQPVQLRTGSGSAGIAVPQLTARDHIPAYHKLALRAHAVGDPVVKYGETIGTATQAIQAGEHVHTHNLRSPRGETSSPQNATEVLE